MKRLFTLVLVLFASSVWAAHHGPLRVALFENGPVVVTDATNDRMSRHVVIGYRSDGVLRHVRDIQALVMPVCRSTYYQGQKLYDSEVRTVIVGREWNGRGHLSASISDIVCPYGDSLIGINLAFTDGEGHWDSLYGQNYFFNLSARPDRYYEDSSENHGELPESVWNFIVSAMY